ncbi:MAG: site-specific DNA-methyltransferase [Myxococcales bacterium]|nr:site-specific DNA-methyltransferase [Myxococcales bacterium]
MSHVGGRVEVRGGSDAERDTLIRALAVSPREEQVMADVHGFHSYPARLHPLTAARLIEGLSEKGQRVLDPFCGSGTVLVEARAAGRRAVGSDLNPLAVELAWLKTLGLTRAFADRLLATAEHIAEQAEERRVAKAAPLRLYGPEDRERYPVHILLELDSLSHGIEQLRPGDTQRALRLVLSSMLTKVAHSEGDTTRRKAPRRLPSGFAIALFTQKTEELAARLGDYKRRLPARVPVAQIAVADARRLRHVPSRTIDLVVTSPPYPGVYDYLDHHLHRLQWLALNEGSLRRDEIGARREYRRLGRLAAARRWQDEIGATLRELRRVLAPEGRVVIVVADSVVDRQALRADAELQRAAERSGFEVAAVASQPRPLFLQGAERAFADAPRQEHVALLVPAQGNQRR